MTVRATVLLAALALTAATVVAKSQEVARLPAEPVPVPGQPTPHPADVTATMRALLADPTLWESAGLAENNYDFNAPNGIPGFGPMDSGDRRVARAQ